MAKQKQPDRLSIESSKALAAGMSYGKWKAMQNPTVIIQPQRTRGIKRICEWCGKEYERHDNRASKYCSYECQHLADKKRMRDKKRERKQDGKA